MDGLLKEAEANAETASLDDPALESAINFLGSKLYTEDLSLQIAEQLDKSSVSMPKILATIAYKLAERSDTETDGDIKEENLSILGMMALNEVFTIAEETGMNTTSADISAAFKHMIVLFAQDQGLPQEQVQNLANAMAQVNDEQFAQEAENMPDNLDEMLPDDDIPVAEDTPEETPAQTQEEMRA